MQGKAVEYPQAVLGPKALGTKISSKRPVKHHSPRKSRRQGGAIAAPFDQQFCVAFNILRVSSPRLKQKESAAYISDFIFGRWADAPGVARRCPLVETVKWLLWGINRIRAAFNLIDGLVRMFFTLW